MTTGPRRPAVLGLDPSLARAGIAILGVDPVDGITRPTLLTHSGYGGHDGTPWPERSKRIVAQVRSITRIVDKAAAGYADIRLAVIEGPAYGLNMPSAFDRAGVWWGLFSMLAAKQIPIAVVTPSTREKFITGVGSKGNKKLVLEMQTALWKLDGKLANADQADALGLAHMGALHLGWPLPFRTNRRHVENVAAVTWPKVA